MVILKDIKSPQDIWIYSGWVPDKKIKKETSFQIDDDFTGFGVRVEEAKRQLYNLESDGGGTILTAEEMITPNLFNNDNEELYDECEFILLENFVGQLKLRGLDEDGVDVDFDINDFIHHQGADDVFVELPKGTKTQRISFYDIDKYLLAYKRDKTIEKIIE